MTRESVLTRAVLIFEAFDPDHPALSVSEIARRTGLHVATASRLVAQLVEHGLLARDEQRRVRVGMRLWELASRAAPTLGLREAAMPFMEDLHAVIGHHTQLGVLDGREVLFVERLSMPNSVINLTRIAGRLPLHASSSGLVLLAHAPSGSLEDVLGHDRVAYTEATVVDERGLRAMVADVRRSGSPSARGSSTSVRRGSPRPSAGRAGRSSPRCRWWSRTTATRGRRSRR